MDLKRPVSTMVTPEMYPSAFRMPARASFIFECGMSSRGCRDRTAFRTRVSMSAIGSVMVSSPARLGHAGDESLERQVAEADPAHLELAHEAAPPAATLAAIAVADGVL